ncbi:MAG: hypothetical protein K0U47_01340 [Epsilonproteobacteria bacterium]|nr:hypothetical protein [Campylobacterota bacterium]
MFTYEKKTFSFLLFLILVLSGCGGGGSAKEESDTNQTTIPIHSTDVNNTNETPVDNNQSEVKLMKAQLGVLADATVKIYQLDNNQQRTLLYTETTSNGDSFEEVGNFNGHVDVLDTERFYLYEVEGGVDRDSNDDGVLDIVGKTNNGKIRLVAKGKSLKEAELPRVSLASEMLYVHVAKDIAYDFDNLESNLESYVSSIVDEDLNSDGKIDIDDLVNFNPVTQQGGLNDQYDMQALSNAILDNDLSYMQENNSSQIIGGYQVDDGAYYMRDLVLSPDGSTVYTIASTRYSPLGLVAIDVTEKKSPQYLDNLSINIENPYGITISNNGEKVFVADEYNGLQIINSVNPESLKPLSAYNEEAYVEDVVLSKDNTKAFVAIDYGDNMLEIVDIQNSDTLALLGSVASPVGSFTLKLSHDETKVFSLTRQDLKIIDVQDVANPRLLSELNITESINDVVLTKDDTKAFIALGTEGIAVLDVSNVLEPQIIATLNIREDSTNNIAYAYDLVLSHDEKRLFVAHYSEGLKIIDVQDLHHPKLIKTIKTPGYVESVVLSPDGKTAYVADEASGLQIIDVSLWSGE